ncbi:MAG: hypothetical protein REI09_09400 [Candidatus Dactylopiibacterium sp.]|nr:hypothetical protein [Candidatus Dactylopiibacterium sp.]
MPSRDSRPVTLQRVDIEPDMCLTIHLDPRTRLCCQGGSLRLTQNVAWAGSLPVQLGTDLQPGDQSGIERAGWVQLRAGREGARLRLETAPAPLPLWRRALAGLRRLARLRSRPTGVWAR